VYDISTTAKSYITQDVDSWSRPAIYDSRIVWGANGGVYMRDISTSTQTRIAYGGSPDIYDTKITYTYDDGNGRGVSVYDITTKKTTGVYSSDPSYPHIYGNKVIWSDFYTRMGYIQMYDLVTEKTVDVTSDNTGNTLPEYANSYADAGDDTGTHAEINGNIIVYSKAADDQFGYAGVYVYDIPTGQSIQLYNYPREVYTTPEVYENIVVWGFDTSYGPGTSDTGIYLCDLAAQPTKPEATFTANVTSGTAPLTVLFTNVGTGGNPTAWNWTFGDGINSKHVETATHTFTNPGNYTVNLTVSNDAGSDTAIK
jgi:beta propeller repeat protein